MVKRKTARKVKRKDLTTWGGNKPNTQIYKTQPNSRWRTPTDVARNARQAKSLVRHTPKEYDAIIVKTPGKGKKVFPYHIWTINNPDVIRHRAEQYKKNHGKRWSN